ncbi:NAD(P)H-dependent flavin oxidoreductase [Oribacterium sp. WCC10]|uniref:NAD(P)H-dependent flavin oxidoreductase n=1 Tax=Oribacterium sp. WCC10 TaxID=1855343 RepID=UPI0008F3CECE|nr:nitronate monooxygenase family protein [Oribacterium sp. WCC10]SFG15325.1 NAD(P)H-dependent flavin oxidoreductase YrpB, nitropropane dioxygenase family [Oribacterium sp. WCC10]
MALLTIHGKEIKIPLIQGGMGVGVSLEKLAGAVAGCGGIGCISTADCGYREDDFMKNPEEANLRALKEEIRKAKEISHGMGLIAINAMVATQQYAEAVKTAVKSGVDAVISGAGLPLDLPEHVPEGEALIAPIVSSDRAFNVIARSWERHYHRYPDFVVLEGPKAGGHLGFKEKELLEGTCGSVTDILKKLVEAVKPYEEAIGRKIPVFAAGGIWDKADIEEVQDLGAAGVQMATRFIATEECDASQAYKDTLLNASQDEVRIIHSPVGMPGRAVFTPLIQKLESFGRIPPVHCSRCIKTCNPAQVPYCITRALIEAVKGNYEEGLFFTGDNVGRLDKMTTVPELIRELGF